VQTFGPLILFISCLFLCSCGPRNLDDYAEEGEGIVRSLIQDLKIIHTREQLLAAASELQRQFEKLGAVMVAAEDFASAHPEADRGISQRFNHDLSDQLRVELNRLYRLEGGRQIIEKSQEKALFQLDACKRKQATSLKK